MVEILLSTYNGERFIEEQIKSIMSQSYKDWHLTIRDDGSTDATVALLNKIASSYSDKISVIDDKNKIS